MSVVKDISLKSGVSLSTVSLVLNNKPGISDATRRKVLAAAAELGYQDYTPRGRSKRNAASLQFIFYKKHGLIATDTPFFANVLEGVEADELSVGSAVGGVSLKQVTAGELEIGSAIGSLKLEDVRADAYTKAGFILHTSGQIQNR